MTIDCSLGETETLVMRAGRGAGLSWGQAQETGRAVTRLAAVGLPAPVWLAALLPKIEYSADAERCPQFAFDVVNGTLDKRWTASGPGICPIALGCHLSDVLPLLPKPLAPTGFEFKAVWWPALIAGFVMPATERLGLSIRLAFGAAELWVARGVVLSHTDRQSFCIAQAETTFATLTSLGADQCPTVHGARETPTVSRCLIEVEVYARLQAYAHKTYVPSTAATRAEGAGAGLHDND